MSPRDNFQQAPSSAIHPLPVLDASKVSGPTEYPCLSLKYWVSIVTVTSNNQSILHTKVAFPLLSSFLETGFFFIVDDGLHLAILQPQASTGITGKYHYIWLRASDF